jgi:hypothetical protein
MSLPIPKHIEFFEQQLFEMEHSRLDYLRASVRGLWKSGKLYIGRIWGYDENRGQVILRFKKGRVPRLKVPYQVCLIGSAVSGSPDDWNFTY